MSGEFRVGPSLVQPSLNSIVRNGKTTHLEPKMMEVLVYLAEHQGEVVTKEQLMRVVWAETFVTDDVLIRSISELRRALEDDAKEPRVIQTIPKRGYRLMVAVEQVGKPRRRKVAGYAVATGLIVALAVFGWLAWHSRYKRQLRLIVRQLTAHPADNPLLRHVISPDGKYLAYCDDAGISLQHIDTGEARLLPRTKSFCVADWFPDGTTLAALKDNDLWVVSSVTGAMRKIAHNIWAAWVSPDGARIAFFKIEGDGTPGAPSIWVMDADGENQRIVAKAEAGTLYWTFSWAPNGQRFIDLKGWGNSESAIEMRDLHGAQPAVIVSDPRLGFRGVCWLADGRIVYALSEAPPREDENLWIVRLDSTGGRASGRPIRITDFTGYFLDAFSASRDGKRLGFMQSRGASAVYVGELQANGTRLIRPQRLTLDNWFNWPSGWSSDSHAVLFVSLGGNGSQIFKQGLDERTPEKLFAGAEEYPWATFSPDGKWLLFWAVSQSRDRLAVRLMRLPVSGGPPEVVLTIGQLAASHHGRLTASHQCALWRPNFCVLEEQDPSGNQRVFSAFDPSQGRLVEIKRMNGSSFAPYAWWSLSPDGTRIAVAEQKPTIRILNLTTGAEQSLTAKTDALFQRVAWSSDGRALFASGWFPSGWSAPGSGALFNIDMQGNTHVLMQGSHAEFFGFPAPSPDGKRLAFAMFTGESNAAIIENF